MYGSDEILSVSITNDLQGNGNINRIIPATNFAGGGTQTKTFEELLYSPSSVGTLQQE